jgi:hypothetical protein
MNLPAQHWMAHLALDRKCRLVTVLLTCQIQTALNIKVILEGSMCRKCGQEEESSYHKLCQYLALAGYRINIWMVVES